MITLTTYGGRTIGEFARKNAAVKEAQRLGLNGWALWTENGLLLKSVEPR